MVTDYPQLTSVASSAGETTGAPGVIARTVTRVNQALCGLTGHDTVRHFEGKRVMMRCTSCGYDTPGWEVSGDGPRRSFEGDAQRHQIVRH